MQLEQYQDVYRRILSRHPQIGTCVHSKTPTPQPQNIYKKSR